MEKGTKRQGIKKVNLSSKLGMSTMPVITVPAKCKPTFLIPTFLIQYTWVKMGRGK